MKWKIWHAFNGCSNGTGKIWESTIFEDILAESSPDFWKTLIHILKNPFNCKQDIWR